MAEPDAGATASALAEPPPALPPAAGTGDGAARRPRLGPRATFAIGLVLLVGGVALRQAQAAAGLVVAVAGVAGLWHALVLAGRRRWGARFEPGLWLAAGWLAAVVCAAVAADWLPLAESRDPSRTLDEPILAPVDLFSAHPLGTDRQGLDVLGGIVHGSRVSLVVGLGAVGLGMLVGGVLGMLAGYYRRRLDSVLNLLNDALLSFPPLVLLLALAAVVRPSVRNITLALGVLAVPTFFRLARANTMVYAQRDFVLAARALGARGRRVLARELVPNVLLSALSYAFIVVAVLIVAEASLSFLGLSIQRPEPTWGNLIASGETDFEKHPRLVFAPGAALFLTVLALNRVGDWTRRHWDPRGRKL